MAFRKIERQLTRTANAAILVNRICKLNSDGTVAAATATSDAYIGISPHYNNDVDTTNAADANDVIPVQTEGVATVALVGTVTAGAKLTASTAGQAIATTTDTDHYVGLALEAGVSGETISVLLRPGMVAG